MSTPDERARGFVHALTFSDGDFVTVDAPRYRGPGVITRRTHWESHVVALWDTAEPHLAVLLENGNTWFYPALSVTHAPVLSASEPAPV